MIRGLAPAAAKEALVEDGQGVRHILDLGTGKVSTFSDLLGHPRIAESDR